MRMEIQKTDIFAHNIWNIEQEYCIKWNWIAFWLPLLVITYSVTIRPIVITYYYRSYCYTIRYDSCCNCFNSTHGYSTSVADSLLNWFSNGRAIYGTVNIFAFLCFVGKRRSIFYTKMVYDIGITSFGRRNLHII